MKKTLFSLIFPLFLVQIISCNSTTKKTREGEDAIKAEVQQTMTNLLRHSSDAKLDSLLTYFYNSPDFKALAATFLDTAFFSLDHFI